MAERLTLIDGLCRECKSVLERHDVSNLSPNAALVLKAEVASRGFLPAHYTADAAAVKVPLLAHKPKCKAAQIPEAEQLATEVISDVLDVPSKAKKAQAKKRKKLGKRKK